MNSLKQVVLIAAALVATSALSAQELPRPAGPEKEHEWLGQLVGEWETNAEAILEPGKPPIKCQGTATTRSIGGLWIVTESNGAFMDIKVTGMMTVGYDPKAKKYIGTWIDSMNNHLWTYEGTLDKAGNVLTLAAEGPNPMAPGKTAKYRDAIEIKSKDHYVLRSSMQMDDGNWVEFMTMNGRRK